MHSAQTIAGEVGLRILGWRLVPTDDSHIGSGAKATEPSIEQAYVKEVEGNPRYAELNFHHKLFVSANSAATAYPMTTFSAFAVCVLMWLCTKAR